MITKYPFARNLSEYIQVCYFKNEAPSAAKNEADTKFRLGTTKKVNNPKVEFMAFQVIFV